MGTPGATTQAVTMKSFVLSSLFACGLAAPTTHVNSGVPVGPLTPAFGDAVATPKGFRSLALEGFSEDLNQDGFVDPIVPAVAAPAPVFAPAPITHTVAAPAPVFAQAPIARTVAAPAFAHQVAPVFSAPAPVAAPIVRTVVNQAPVAVAPQF